MPADAPLPELGNLVRHHGVTVARGRVARYRHVARVLARHGFGYVLADLGLAGMVPFHWGLFGHRRRVTPYTQAEHLRLAFEDLGAGFIKLGQILSTRADLLPPDFVAQLAKLRADVPPEPPSAIEAELRRELGRGAEEVFAEFERRPIGSASIGQVHAARLRTGEEVAVKVQRPGVEEQVETDVAILLHFARLAQERTALGKVYDLPGMVEEWAETLREELDYGREADHAERLRRRFAGTPGIRIPIIYRAMSTRRVLTMERLRGIRIDDLASLDAAGVDRRVVAERLLRFIFEMVLGDGFFHADPHPGNFLVGPDGAIGVLDYGMVGRLDEPTRARLVLLFQAAVAERDMARVADRLLALGVVGSTHRRDALERDLARFLSLYWDRPLEQVEVGRVLDVFLTVARRNHMRMPPDLALTAKTVIIHEEMARALAPGLDLSAVLGETTSELRRRLTAPAEIEHRLETAATDSEELALTLPRRVDRLLGQAERGDLEVRARLDEANDLVRALERSANRVALATLASGFLVGVAVLLLIAHTAGLHRLAILFLVVGIAAVLVLSLWWAGATLRRRGG